MVFDRIADRGGVMAYFPNGTSFADWQQSNCADYLNYRDNGSGSFGCPITDAHFLLAGEMCDKDGEDTETAKVLLNFIPEDGLYAAACKMRLTRETIETEERERNYQLDLERYETAMADSRRAA